MGPDDRYQILKEVGRGGMGVVYRAVDTTTQAPVALKVLIRLDAPVARKRFQREAEALRRVDHPGVVRLVDHAETPKGEPYLVMEWIPGLTLQAELDQGGQLYPEQAVAYGLELCDAVAACHHAGVLHRDLKPENVMITADGTLKLTDFGITRDTDPSQSLSALSLAGKFLGSPGYWSPEQAEGRIHDIGEATDVFGIGATLFAMLTAQPPHQGSSLLDLLAQIRATKPPPSTLAPAVPPWLDGVVLRALALNPADRYPSVMELASALRGSTRSPQLRAESLPTGLAPGLAIVILGSVIALGVVILSPSPKPPPARASLPAPTPAASRPESPRTSGPLPTSSVPVTPEPEQSTPTEEVVRPTPTPSPVAKAPLEQRGLELEALRREGVGFLNEQSWSQALARFEQILAECPDDASATWLRAATLEGAGNLDEAILGYRRALELAPSSDLLRTRLQRAEARRTR